MTADLKWYEGIGLSGALMIEALLRSRFVYRLRMLSLWWDTHHPLLYVRQLQSMRAFCQYLRPEIDREADRRRSRIANALIFAHNEVAYSYNAIRPFWRLPIWPLALKEVTLEPETEEQADEGDINA